MKTTNLIISALVSVLGLILILNPQTSLMVIVVVTGVWVILTALNDIIKTRVYSTDSVFRTLIITRSIISFVIGLIAVILPVQAAGAFVKAVCIVLAVYFALKAISSLYILIRIKAEREISKRLFFSFLESVTASVILFALNGEKVANTIIIVIGAVLLAAGVITILYTIKAAPIVKDESKSDGE
ncbi:MAG: DUF308 domain-containing protein [Treponema sp.]|nr:DUF308 domain-containing protein [Treponema sp.]